MVDSVPVIVVSGNWV